MEGFHTVEDVVLATATSLRFVILTRTDDD